MDLTTILGLIVGIGGILLGQVMEGGHVGSIMQLTAAFIVFGGTIGAVLVTAPMEDVKTGLKLLKLAFLNPKGDDSESIIKELLDAAQIARKESILSLEKKLSQFTNPYMQTIFRFVIDGVDSNTIRDIFENEIYLEEEHLSAGAKLYTDAGGYSPTIGIIGAVLGLIHVMENLSDTSKLGAGIAVAFVATVYGVGAANLIFLPIGNKLKRKIKMQAQTKEMILTGALGIVSGLNPFIIEEKLRAYVHTPRKETEA
ncbi:MAG TPA: flagellar motor protein [Bdellovibrionales bacterium]|nr:flagellar motor protein [Bdellovibrionales bacterium]